MGINLQGGGCEATGTGGMALGKRAWQAQQACCTVGRDFRLVGSESDWLPSHLLASLPCRPLARSDALWKGLCRRRFGVPEEPAGAAGPPPPGFWRDLFRFNYQAFMASPAAEPCCWCSSRHERLFAPLRALLTLHDAQSLALHATHKQAPGAPVTALCHLPHMAAGDGAVQRQRARRPDPLWQRPHGHPAGLMPQPADAPLNPSISASQTTTQL